jgi:dTDP-4-amino-4,6-dideoxygalactose transaminase
LIAHLKMRGILSVFHYVPLHSAPMGRRLAPHAGELPITTDVSGRLLRLPLFVSLTESELASIVDAVLAWRPGGGS